MLSVISIPGSFSFAKLVMMPSAPAKSAGDARYVSQDPFIRCPIQSRLQSVLGVRSFYDEHNKVKSFSYFRPAVQVTPPAKKTSVSKTPPDTTAPSKTPPPKPAPKPKPSPKSKDTEVNGHVTCFLYMNVKLLR